MLELPTMAAVFFSSLTVATAQPGTNSPVVPSAATEVMVKPTRVIGVVCHRIVKDANLSSSGCIIGLDDAVTLKVKNLGNLIKESQTPKREIVLFLDNIPVKGLTPRSINAQTNEITFVLERTEESRKAWASLLGFPHAQKLTTRYWGRKQIPISLGLDSGLPVPSDETVGLIIVRKWHMWAWMGGVFLLLVALWYADARGNLLRDPGPNPPSPFRKPRSLAKCQMAFWFILVVFSFTFIWLVTGELDTISESILVMIGIGTGTALGVAVQNARKEKSSPLLVELNQLQTEIASKESEIKVARSAAAVPAGIQALEDQLKDLKETLHAKIPRSLGLFDDLLTDAEGYTLHRLQMVVWTGVLGIIFIYRVWGHLAMPEFSATLLALMGISSGTYIGFMLQERHSSEETRK